MQVIKHRLLHIITCFAQLIELIFFFKEEKGKFKIITD